MNKKCLIAVAMAGILSVVQATAVFAVPSTGTDVEVVPPTPSRRPSGGGGGGSSSGGGSSTSGGAGAVGPGTVVINDTATPLASGIMALSMGGLTTTQAATSVGVNGSTLSVVIGNQTAAGSTVTANEKGEAVSGELAFSFANDAAATAGLPENIVASINAINAGQPLSAAVSSATLNGFNALTGTHAIIATDPATGAVKTGSSEVTLYVPNLVQGLNNVSLLFYDNATGLWTILPAAAVNLETKTITVNLTGSGTLTVIYR